MWLFLKAFILLGTHVYGLPFMSMWNVQNNNTQITLPFLSGIPFNIQVNWGDPSNSSGVTFASPPVSYNYKLSGVYNISIQGVIDRWGSFAADDTTANSLVSIFSWGGFTFSSISNGSFAFCRSLSFISAIDVPIFLPQTSLDYTFMNGGDEAFLQNQILQWDTENVTSMRYMFYNTNISSISLVFNTKNVLSFEGMFEQCVLFNSDVFFDLSSCNNTARMFRGASMFNKAVNFHTPLLSEASYMFADCLAFNSKINFTNVSSLTSMQSFLQNTPSYNQPLIFSPTPSLRRLSYFLTGASNFNSPIVFPFLENLIWAEFFLAFASSFNQPINLSTTLYLQTASHMFANTTKFNSQIIISTSSIQSFDNFFSGSSFSQDVSFWQTNNSVTCDNFCDRCGYPFFTNCTFQCNNGVVRKSAQGWNVCNCPVGEYLNSTLTCGGVECIRPVYIGLPGSCACGLGYSGTVVYDNTTTSGCALTTNSPTSAIPTSAPTTSFPTAAPTTVAPSVTVDLCSFAVIGLGLEAACIKNSTPIITILPNVPSISPSLVISPLYNITLNTSAQEPGSSSFSFVLPFNPLTRLSYVTQKCFQPVVRCEWLNEDTGEFETSGCQLVEDNIRLDSGINTITHALGGGGALALGSKCVCVHLTVFALVMRSELAVQELCQAETSDYVLLSLYGFLGCILIFQLARLLRVKAFAISCLQHSVILFAVAFRIVFLAAKPIIKSVAGLVFLGLIPSFLALSIFIHILLAWVSLQVFAMTTNPFARFRIPFMIAIVCVFLITLSIVVAVAVTNDDPNTQDARIVNIVSYGSYILAAIYACVCFMILFSGLGLNRMLKETSLGTGSAKWRGSYRWHVFFATIGSSCCLFVGACLWVVSVQKAILVNLAANESVSIAFYLVDWISLCLLTSLFSGGVRSATKSKSAPKGRISKSK